MSSDILGIPFDLHGGGTDLIFPHHECEIAQSEGLGRGNPAATWMHVSPMLYAGEKMSKSLGNLVFAKDLLRKHDPAVIRLALMYYHHRTGGEWQPELLDEATELLQRVHETNASVAAAQQFLDEVRSALDDDLNTPAIVETLRRFVGRTTTRKSAGNGQEVVNQTLSLIGLLPA
jgi:cysteinyl-tRNA synthetase